MLRLCSNPSKSLEVNQVVNDQCNCLIPCSLAYSICYDILLAHVTRIIILHSILDYKSTSSSMYVFISRFICTFLFVHVYFEKFHSPTLSITNPQAPLEPPPTAPSPKNASPTKASRHLGLFATTNGIYLTAH